MKPTSKKTPPVYKIVLCLFLCAGFIVCGVLFMKKNEIDKNNDRLREELEAAQIKQDEMKEELEAPFDADYVRRMARKLLGYCLPGEVIFYSDVED
ncbi:MAG: septum formation initiator family protein [Clostridia bacterium]|nr:septum formation initiator family protein [Clostridia bacterium]